MKRQKIAALFKVDNTVVSRAMRILGVLNEASRGLVLENLQKSGKSRESQGQVLENL